MIDIRKVIIPSQDLIDSRRKLVIPLKGMTVKILRLPAVIISIIMLTAFIILNYFEKMNIYSGIAVLLIGSIIIIVVGGTPGSGKRTVIDKIKKIKEYNNTKQNKIYKKSKKC